MSLRNIIVTALVALVFAAVRASGQVGHTHCDRRAWGPIELTPTGSPNFPIVLAVGANVTIHFNGVNIPLPAAPGSTGCEYEVSDITRIKLTLELAENSEVLVQSFSGGGVAPTNAGPYYFANQVLSKVFTFNPHEGGGPGGVLTLSFPNPSLNFQLTNAQSFSGIGTAQILGARMEVSGNHYYIPAPGPMALAMVAGVCAMLRSRRRA